MGLFDKMIAALRSPVSPPDELRRALAEAKAVHHNALQDRARLAEQRSAILIGSDVERKRHKADLASAADREQDAAEYIAELERRLAAAEVDAEQLRRRAIYDAAAKKAEACVRDVDRQYKDAVRKMMGVLRLVADTQLIVEEANGQLPDGAQPLVDPDIMRQAGGYLVREVLKEEEVELWAYPSGAPLADEVQGKVQRQDDGKGYLAISDINRDTGLERRRFRRITFHPGVAMDVAPSIAPNLSLPGYYQAGPWMVGQGGLLAAKVVEAERLLAAAPAAVKRAVEVELVPVAGAKREAEQIITYPSRAFQPAPATHAAQPRRATVTARTNR